MVVRGGTGSDKEGVLGGGGGVVVVVVATDGGDSISLGPPMMGESETAELVLTSSLAVGSRSGILLSCGISTAGSDGVVVVVGGGFVLVSVSGVGITPVVSTFC